MFELIGLITFHLLFAISAFATWQQSQSSKYRFDGRGGIQQFRRWPSFRAIFPFIFVIILWISFGILLH